MVSISFSKRDLKWIVPLVVILVIGVGIAYSGSEPSVMGHSAGELEGVCLSDGTACDVDKAYVDGAISGSEGSLTPGVTGESMMANGMQMKWGTVCVSVSSSTTVTFDNAFSNGIFQAYAVWGVDIGDTADSPGVHTLTVSSIKVKNGNGGGGCTNANWFAIGY